MFAESRAQERTALLGAPIMCFLCSLSLSVSLSLSLFELLCFALGTGSPCGPLVRATPSLILSGWARLYNIGCPNVVFPRMGSLFARHR